MAELFKAEGVGLSTRTGSASTGRSRSARLLFHELESAEKGSRPAPDPARLFFTPMPSPLLPIPPNTRHCRRSFGFAFE